MDGQLNKEEAKAQGIDEETFEKADTDNSGKLDDQEEARARFGDEEMAPPEDNQAWDEGDTPLTPSDTLQTRAAYGASEADILPEEGGYSEPGALDSSDSVVDVLTGSETNKGVEARFGGLPYIDLTGLKFGGKSINANGLSPESTDFKSSPIDLTPTKDILRSLGGGGTDGLAGVGTLDGVSEDSFNPEVEHPSYSTGQDIELPGTGSATSSTGPTQKLFHDIVSGNVPADKTTFNMPHTPNAVGGKKASTLSKMSKNKKSEEAPKMTPMKLQAGKNAITQGKENIYERIIDKVDKNFKTWPLAPDGESHIKEKGTVAVYAKKDWISVKYGSYRKVLLDTFAQEHPQFLPQILEVVNS